MNDEKNFWLMEYQNVAIQFQKFLDLYIKTFIIYIGIVGLLLKFALDASSTPQLKFMMVSFGLFCSALFFGCVYYAKKMTRQLIRKRKKTLEELNQITEDETVSGYWASNIFVLFNIFVIIGWIYIIIM